MRKIKITLIILSLIFFSAWFVNASQEKMEEFYYAQLISSVKEKEKKVLSEDKIHLDINSEAAISKKIDKNGNKAIIFEKNSKKGLPIASLTKLMTAIITLENYDLDEPVLVSKEAAYQQNAYWGGNLKPNQTKTIGELLELMLIFSSNDSAFALSEKIGRENFIEKMNNKADELNLKNTHFINSSGLDPITDEIPNYSTAQDLLRIAEYVLENYPFLLKTSLKSINHKLNNSLSDLSLFENQELVGGKTGYTKKAGGCLLTILKNKKGEYFINIVLGTKSYKERIKETQKIINLISLQ